MNLRVLGKSTPQSIYIPTGHYALSRLGKPMGTHGMMGCLAIIVHDPETHQGCLGHVEPQRHISTFLARCIHLLGIADKDCLRLEIAFIGGRRAISFAGKMAEALDENLLTAVNCYDGRRTIDKPIVGAPIREYIKDHNASCVVYEPTTGTLHIGNSLAIPNYIRPSQPYQKIPTAGLGMDMISHSLLGT